MTGFLSLWISNTATAAMMLPIAQAVLLQLKKDKSTQNELSRDQNVMEGELSSSSPKLERTSVKFSRSVEKKAQGATYESLDEASADNLQITAPAGDWNLSSDEEDKGDNDVVSAESEDKSFMRLSKSLMLGVAYSANIGGTGTLTGTGPNIVLAGMARYVWGEMSRSMLDGNCLDCSKELQFCFSKYFLNFVLCSILRVCVDK